jgi:hypothetical protein
VLDRRAAQRVVQLDGLISGRAVFILRGFASYPEVDVPGELIRVDVGLLEVGVKDDVVVADMEAPEFALRPRLDTEMLYEPHLQARLHASASPLRLGIGRRLLALLLNITAEQTHVSVLPVDHAILLHGS